MNFSRFYIFEAKIQMQITVNTKNLQQTSSFANLKQGPYNFQKVVLKAEFISTFHFQIQPPIF